MKILSPRFFIPLTTLLVSVALFLERDLVFGLLGLKPESELGFVWNYFFLTIIWLIGAVFFNRLNSWLLWDKLVARAIGGPVPAVLKEISAVIVYMLTVTAIVGLVYHKSITAFLAALGAGAVVLGFGLRNLFSDIFTGLAINIDRSFVIGDWIEINEGISGVTVGQITDIGWRCTSLTTEEKTNVVVPNGVLGTERMVNISRPSLSTRFEISLTVEFSVSPERVKRVMMAAVRALETEPGFDASKKPVILIDETTPLGVKYIARYWILPWTPISPTTANDMVHQSILQQLRTAGISLAYPKTDIYAARMPSRQFGNHSNDDLLALLRRMEIFQPLNDDELGEVIDAMQRKKLAEGQVLLRQGDDGDSLFVLIEGLLNVSLKSGENTRNIDRIHPGECLGEMSLLTGEKRSATISAVCESVLYEINKDSISPIMEKKPELLGSLSEILAKRQYFRRNEQRESGKNMKTAEIEGIAQQFVTRMRDFFGLRVNSH